MGLGPLDIGTNIPLRVHNLKRPSLENARFYYRFASSVYCNQTARLKNWKCRYCPSGSASGLKVIKLVSNDIKGTFGFVSRNSGRKEIVVAFRGTAVWQNFIEDLLLIGIPIAETQIKVHAGFYETTMTLYAQVVSALVKLRRSYPKYKIIMTGHSLGAAMAAITTFKLITNNTFPGSSYELYTYGEPRMGNLAFATKFNSWRIPSARVVSHSDIVPHSFPSKLGFIHKQNELWMYKQNSTELKYCSKKVYEDPRCSNSLGNSILNYTVAEHFQYFEIPNANLCD